jgi:putative addiction module component (TIGR02574 family)
MPNTLDEARKVVMELSDEDRQVLAEEIMQARWEPAWRDAWAAEIERRVKQMEDGTAELIPAEEVVGDVRSTYLAPRRGR